jgi:hypothetical protein
MSIFGRLFDSFSARPEAALKLEHRMPETTRIRIVMLCKEVFSNDHVGYAAAAVDFTQDFWNASAGHVPDARSSSAARQTVFSGLIGNQTASAIHHFGN